MNEDVCDFGKGQPDVHPNIGSDVVRFSNRDLRIDFNVKINVTLEPGLSRVALLNAPDSCDPKCRGLDALDQFQPTALCRSNRAMSREARASRCK